MSNSDLFGPTPGNDRPELRPEARRPVGEARILRPDRHQTRLVPTDLDSLIEEEHPARAVWAIVEKLDLSGFDVAIRARGGQAGRPAIDPRILVTLWLYATSEGVGSARELERLCEAHGAYRWIAGGVHANYHTLADFRVEHAKALDELMTQVLTALTHEGLVELKRVAQDGMRVRASAGAASFHREKTLRRCWDEAQEQVQRLRQEVGDPAVPGRRQAAQERAARERQERLTRALEILPEVREAKADDKKAQARVSSTDPEARVMKMPDGGYRPGYNVQLSADTKTRIIVGVRVTNRTNDNGQLVPMLGEIEQRTGSLPGEHLADAGFAKQSDIEAATQQGVTLYVPVQKPHRQDVDPFLPKPKDSPGVAAWRRRMGTEEAKRIYLERAATIETINGDLRIHRGLDRLLVRGTAKVKCIALWAALTYNILRWIAAAEERKEG